MSAFDSHYRPRRPTKAEEQAGREQELAERERRVKRVKREHDFASSRESGLIMSSISGIGYRDFTLGPSKPSKSRSQLDQLAYDNRRTPARPPSSSVPSLQSICISRIVDDFGAPGAWDRLDRFSHLPHVPALLEAVMERVDTLPFGVWSRFASVFGQELPARRRTYRGLCVSDEMEMAWLKAENEAAVQEWAQAGPRGRELQPTPTFFLAALDLAHDTTFTDSDLSKLRTVAPLLAVLKLDYTRVTDDGLAWLLRHSERDGCYRHLEVLSLKGLRKVSNQGVARLSKLRSLRMLDLRETACTKRIKAELTVASRTTPTPPPPWGTARFKNELDRIALELELFGPSFSLTRILTYLHSLAHRFNPVTNATPPSKPIAIHLDAISRKQVSSAPSSAPKSASDLYVEQMALATSRKNAAYNQAYGAVTSTVGISRRLLEESGIAETEKGAAFRSRNDAVAGGSYVGPGKTGGRSLFDVGQRKLTAQGGAGGPLSDTEEEEEIEEERRAQEEEESRAWNARPARGAAQFYQTPRPVVSEPRQRQIVAAEPSDFLLIRHLPYRPPHDPPPAPADTPTPLAIPLQSRTNEPTAVRRRQRAEEGSDDVLTFISSAPTVPPTREPISTTRAPKPTNPFSTKRPPSTKPPLSCRPTPAAVPDKPPAKVARPLSLAPIFQQRR